MKRALASFIATCLLLPGPMASSALAQAWNATASVSPQTPAPGSVAGRAAGLRATNTLGSLSLPLNLSLLAAWGNQGLTQRPSLNLPLATPVVPAVQGAEALSAATFSAQVRALTVAAPEASNFIPAETGNPAQVVFRAAGKEFRNKMAALAQDSRPLIESIASPRSSDTSLHRSGALLAELLGSFASPRTRAQDFVAQPQAMGSLKSLSQPALAERVSGRSAPLLEAHVVLPQAPQRASILKPLRAAAASLGTLVISGVLALTITLISPLRTPAQSPVETPYGTRFYEAPGAGPGVELYSRSIGGQTLFLRYKDGVPTVTHVMQDGTWAPFSGKLPEAVTRSPFLQKVDGTLYAYRLGEDGVGRRTHQAIEEGSLWAWIPLPNGQPLSTPPQGFSRRLVRAAGSTFLVDFSAQGKSARVTHVGGGEDGDTLRPIGRGADGPASFEAGSPGIAADGSATRYWFSFSRDKAGSYQATLTHEQVAGGWIRLTGGRPLEKGDLPIAWEIVTLESRVQEGRSQIEARQRVGEQGADSYPSVASRAAARLGSAPAAITGGEVHRRMGGEEIAIPGIPGARAQIVLAAPQGQNPPRRQFIVFARNEEDSIRIEQLLKRYKQELIRQVAGQTSFSLRGFTQALSANLNLTPDHVTVLIAGQKDLAQSLVEINQDIARMPLLAAGEGALQDPEAGKGERNLSGDVILFPRLRMRGAAKRVDAKARSNYKRAQGEMWAMREEIAQIAAQGYQAGLERSGLEAVLAFRAENIRSARVAALSADSEALLRDHLGGPGVAVPYRLADSGTYLLPLEINEADLPPGPKANGLKLAAAVDYQLSLLAQSHPKGIPAAELERVWSEQIRRVYGKGVTSERARGYARRILAPPAPPEISRSEDQPISGVYQASNGWWYGRGPHGQWYYFTHRYDSEGQEVWLRSR